MLVNELNINLKNAHFWGMDEWVLNNKEVGENHPLSFKKADMDLCFNRIRSELRMPESNLHFPKADTSSYIKSWEGVQCKVMQGGQGDIKHWAFNDPLRREGKFKDTPPTLKEYRQLSTRIVDLHPVTISQNARTSGGGVVTGIPTQAITVGPVQTWQAEKVSIWQAGMHDNPFGMRLTTLMISKKIIDSSVPMSLLADHPNVQFNFYRPAISNCDVEMH
jgi:glucosamine-6-phosphate deaminase